MSRHPPGFTNHNLLSSDIIEVKTGSSNRSFFAHRGILLSQTSLFSTTLQAPSVRGIGLSEWDSAIVGRFLHFLYTGDYEVLGCIEHEGSGDEEEKTEDGRGGVGTPDTTQSLAAHDYDIETNFLLAHAEVYALAQSIGVYALRSMALERLKAGLEEIDQHKLRETPKVAVNVIGLLEYVYSHTIPGEPMRDLVLGFAAGNFEKLVGEDDMASLLRKGGDFMVELMERVAGRVCDLEGGIRNQKGQCSASENEVQQSDIATMREVGGSKRNSDPQQPDTMDASEVHQVEVTNTENNQGLETVSAVGVLGVDEVRGFEALHGVGGEELGATKTDQATVSYTKPAEVPSTAEIWELVVANSGKIEQLDKGLEAVRDRLRKKIIR